LARVNLRRKQRKLNRIRRKNLRKKLNLVSMITMKKREIAQLRVVGQL
jgi:hypothetical protein